MRRTSLPLAIGAFLALTIAGPVAAQRAVHITGIPIAFSVVAPDASAACGYEVTVTLTGTGSATLVYNDAGLIIREVDSEPAARITWSGNGNSFSYPTSSQIVVTSYSEGASLGAPARTTETGFFGKAPGSTPNAGPDVLLGHVVAFTDEGLPLVEYDEVLASHGPRPDFDAGICAALDG
jgi:hypothetical protein